MNLEIINVLMILILIINVVLLNIYRVYCVIIFFIFIFVICWLGFSIEYVVNVKGIYLKLEKSCKLREMRWSRNNLEFCWIEYRFYGY